MHAPPHEPVRSSGIRAPLLARMLALWLAFGVLGTASHGQCGFGDCLAPHPTVGCEDTGCCADVCSFNPVCCQVEWDASCVEAANFLCEICGATLTGSCFDIHGTASCADPVCCEAVCAMDPFCCETQWDGLCVQFAGSQCSTGGGTCGEPTAGDCHVAHGTPACSDLTCCTVVCNVAPECCENSWDFICAAIAGSVCQSGTCPVICNPDGATHIEVCDSLMNDCAQAPTALPAGTTCCGDLSVISGIADVDVFGITLADPDGDGLVRASISLESAGPAFAALVSDSCASWAGAILIAQTELCGPVLVRQCVPAGDWKIVVAPGLFPNPTDADRYCPDTRYQIGLEVDQVCAPVCGTGEPCDVPHAAPGCADATCCEAVCAQDPLCCDFEWDAICVKATTAACAVPPPSNDPCASPTRIGVGDHAVDYLGASLDGPDLPGQCAPGGAENVAKDVWFLVEGVTGPVRISSCPGIVHPTLALFSGSCGALVMTDCAREAIGTCDAAAFGTELNLDAFCGDSFLLRVGIVAGTAGTMVIRVEATDCTRCLADLDGSGAVDGADLASVLGNWGGNYHAGGDANGNGVIDGEDLAAILASWGPCP